MDALKKDVSITMSQAWNKAQVVIPLRLNKKQAVVAVIEFYNGETNYDKGIY